MFASFPPGTPPGPKEASTYLNIGEAYTLLNSPRYEDTFTLDSLTQHPCDADVSAGEADERA